MKVGDLVKIRDAHGIQYIGVVIDNDEDGDPVVWRHGWDNTMAYYGRDVEAIYELDAQH
jgi:hypothetical protein